MKAWWRRVRPGIASWAIYGLIRLLGSTWRVRTEGLDEALALSGGKILLGWHGRVAVASKVFRGRGFWAIISLSRDGEMQSRIFKRLGFNVIRGSTGRGGERALVQAIKVLRDGGTMALTPDGPRGPSGIVQEGVLVMSRKTGSWLIPVGVSAKPRKLFRSWDRYMIPLFFAKCVMLFGQGVQIPANASETEIEQIRQRLEMEMHALEQRAEAMMGFGLGTQSQSRS